MRNGEKKRIICPTCRRDRSLSADVPPGWSRPAATESSCPDVFLVLAGEGPARRHLEELALAPDLRRRLGRAARATAMGLSWERVADGWEGILLRLAG